MADELKSNVIKKKDSGFPPYLDFDKLRTKGIEYLGELSGKIWTDHNVHDPGITILEMLCYALLDLGYRTNLPEADIFARHPNDKSTDNNFFTAAQILANNPLTITDYRKLLVDVEGVRNAWLEPATDISDLCKSRPQVDRNPCKDFLNGLYHIYLDVENAPEGFTQEQYNTVTSEKVKQVLMEHRNFCEDFVDIQVLCKQSVGVCAEIEIDESVNPEQVYVTVVEKLRDFLTPSPVFYTLQQLLDKKKSIDDIFSGRPYNLTASHGFVDTEEFDRITLKKAIHLSDVYAVLFEIPGVVSIHRLALNSCGEEKKVSADWKFKLNENHVPEFSVSCSGFKFSRNGMPLSVDFKKYNGLFEFNLGQRGKVLYRMPSPYLDREIPNGMYRSDLDEYYSIQNEFPRIYGIAEGGLPADATPLRQAQALQLKGYLLFFDQLLANYLGQLKNIRSLFALSSSVEEDEQHIHSISQVTSVPDLQKLLRFPIQEDEDSTIGAKGSILVLAVDKQMLLDKKGNDQLKNLRIEEVAPYQFESLAEQTIAIRQIQNDLSNLLFTCEYVTRTDQSVYYYMLTASEEVALLSKLYFTSVDEAKQHAASVNYVGLFEENYRTFLHDANTFSFAVELNITSFSKCLQYEVEDRSLRQEKRMQFLDHLLARFAEKFTDFALLSYSGLQSNDFAGEAIRAKEKFLTHYDDISSNRGKAYNYLANGWNNNNISGFEKRAKALTGIDNWKRHSLCNFVVEQYDEQYEVTLTIGEKQLFKLDQRFDLREDALRAAHSLFGDMANAARYGVEYVAHDRQYSIRVHTKDNDIATFLKRYSSEEDANAVVTNLSRMFAREAMEQDIFVSEYIYKHQLQNYKQTCIRTLHASYTTEAEAHRADSSIVKRVNDKRKWSLEDITQPGTLHYNPYNSQLLQFIDRSGFKVDVNNTIVGKPDKFMYEVLDVHNSFKFISVGEFDSAEAAREHCYELLIRMMDEANYRIQSVEGSARTSSDTRYALQIVVNDSDEAICYSVFNSREEARKMLQEVLYILRKHTYTLVVNETPYRWKFQYHLGYEIADHCTFESVDEYITQDEALKAATSFIHNMDAVSLAKQNEVWQLIPGKTAHSIPAVKLIQHTYSDEEGKLERELNRLLNDQKQIRGLAVANMPEAFQASVDMDAISRQGRYVYRLVDKDQVSAVYSESFPDKQRADQKRRVLSRIKCNRYNYPDICFGRDSIKVVNEDCKTPRYHFTIKSHNLILFESITGYASEEEALNALKEYYLTIFTLALDEKSYGKDILLEAPRFDDKDLCKNNESQVFIPKETMRALGGYDDASVRRMIAMVNQFPVRLVEYGSAKFYSLFPCEENKKESPDPCRDDSPKKHVYYFELAVPDQPNEFWRSTTFFTSLEEVGKALQHFLNLLCYPGNLFIDCDDCGDSGFRIYIREVLAESTERFQYESTAWGKEGVQKFICVSQRDDSFLNFQYRDECCYSFYVACADGLLFHPCQYDTPKKRDAAIERLYQGIRAVHQLRAYQTYIENDAIVLTNGRGEPFARYILRYQRNPCDVIIDLVEIILYGTPTFATEKGVAQMTDPSKGIVVFAYYEHYTLTSWRKMLEEFACYFPVVRTIDEKTNRPKYCIELKLPDFSDCMEDSKIEKPCGCGNASNTPHPICYLAWKSKCCYNSCEDAIGLLTNVMPALLDFKNYHRVFNCDCHSYGIALHYKREVSNNPPATHLPSANVNHLSDVSEIIAVNPQCYSSPKMVCEAVQRAKRLINSEGLHVVEHILLRPRCYDDCQCYQYTEYCENKTKCTFVWKDESDDPCYDDQEICFVPGYDRYSFIATVALPAWPQRFRAPENKKLLERILQREAPAHVLLRVLWLAPHDFCCFEKKYKGWAKWLAQKKDCGNMFSKCDFLEFLFNRNFECLEECQVCGCADDNNVQESCFDSMNQQKPDIEFLDQVNELYCWHVNNCDEYRFTSCDEQQDYYAVRSVAHTADVESIIHQPAVLTIETTPVTLTGIPESVSDDATVSAEKVTLAKQEPQVKLRPKPQWINGRLARYRNDVDEGIKNPETHDVVGKVQIFLKDPAPSMSRLSRLVEDVLKHVTAKKKTKLTKKQIGILIQSCICYFLDKVIFNGNGIESVKPLSDDLDKVRKAKVNLKSILEYWNPEEVVLYEPDLPIDEIREMFSYTERSKTIRNRKRKKS